MLRTSYKENTAKSQKLKAETKKNYYSFIEKMFEDNAVKKYLGVNTFEGETYFNKENFEELMNWMFYFTNIYSIRDNIYTPSISIKPKKKTKKDSAAKAVGNVKDKIKSSLEDLELTSESLKRIKTASIQSGYKVDELKNLLIKKIEKKKSLKIDGKKKVSPKTKKKKS